MWRDAALNRDDVQHVTRLIQTNKLPRLRHLDLHSNKLGYRRGWPWQWGNNLCVMEDVCGRLIEACVTHHHQGELKLVLVGQQSV